MKRFMLGMAAALAIWSADASACNGGRGRAVPAPQGGGRGAATPPPQAVGNDDTDLEQLLEKRAKAASARRATQQPQAGQRPAVRHGTQGATRPRQ